MAQASVGGLHAVARASVADGMRCVRLCATTGARARAGATAECSGSVHRWVYRLFDRTLRWATGWKGAGA